MKLLAFTTSYWNDAAMAEALRPSLETWHSTVTRLFQPRHTFVACGTYSDPALCPIPATVVNSGVTKTKPYNVFFWQYAACAFTAACWHAINLPDWDFLVWFDLGSILGDIDLNHLAREFLRRDEILMGPRWHVSPDTVLSFWKREALARYLHHRVRGNLIEDESKRPLLFEEELAVIYKGRWWNPWPHLWIIRQSHGLGEARPNQMVYNWPMVESPSPVIRQEFAARKKQSPVIHEP